MGQIYLLPECDILVPAIFWFFRWYRNKYQKNLVAKKAPEPVQKIGIGAKKCGTCTGEFSGFWYRYRRIPVNLLFLWWYQKILVLERVLENLGTKNKNQYWYGKNLVPISVLENLVPKIESSTGTGKISGTGIFCLSHCLMWKKQHVQCALLSFSQRRWNQTYLQWNVNHKLWYNLYRWMSFRKLRWTCDLVSVRQWWTMVVQWLQW